MQSVGIIAEYNPFHNGHLFQLAQAKLRSGADAVVCLMSGNFTQRGEPAIVNKWARTAMALQCGADIVIELPTAYALSSARNFAGGAVQLLTAAGIVNRLSFGSETDDLNALMSLAAIFANEPADYRDALKQELKQGYPFPVARLNALKKWFNLHQEQMVNEVDTLLTQPNNILALEYLTAIKRYGSHLQPDNIPRCGAAYHSTAITDSPFASATAIRHQLAETQSLNPIVHTLPPAAATVLSTEFAAGRGPVYLDSFSIPLLTILRTMEAAEIAAFPDVETGLEYRIKKAANTATSFSHLLELIKTKRYTRTRLQRILLAILLNYDRAAREKFEHQFTPQYLRILGFRKTAQPLLKELKKQAALPLLTKVEPRSLAHNRPAFRDMLALDLRATDLYTLAYPAINQRRGGGDFLNSVIRQ